MSDIQRETKVTKRVNNKDMSHYTTYRLPFENHKNKENDGPSVWGEWYEKNGNHLFVVYSYGYHFPIYVYDEQSQEWYGNQDKYSRTTTRHQTLARPSTPNKIKNLSTYNLCRLITLGGVAGVVARRIEHAVNPQ